MSVEIFQHYLDSLDSQRSYFLASDIAEFDAWKARFDDMIRSGDVEPAFVMYARFQQRNRERIQYAIDLLAKEPDWTLKENFEFDREKAPWPASTEELDELWRKRVKNDALSLIADGQDLAGGDRYAAQALRARAEALRPGDGRRGVRESHERLRAHLRSALQLLLGAQLRGIPHPDEPQLRGHRRDAADRGRLRQHREPAARRSGCVAAQTGPR